MQTKEENVNDHNLFDLEECVILKIICGSRAYGLNNENSDTDIRGIYILPIEMQIGIFSQKEMVIHNIGKEDSNFFSLKKFIEVLIRSGPNAIEMLFPPANTILRINDYGESLLKNKDIFLSQQVRKTYYNMTINNIRDALNIELKSHNEYREKYNYDTKQAANALRTIRFGTELLETGKITVHRTNDKNELLNLRNGKYTADEFAIIEKKKNKKNGKLETYVIGGLMRDEFDKFEIACSNSVLPEEINLVEANKLLIELTSQRFNLNIKSNSQSR